ncbi:peroxisomal membrane protein 11B [Bacillus rossius redtenbacheri]|uniref:peroxisomal membrane protein 11B n=1 Tax=Bacillus rossius redtenbacheri TaxID=93214 RepID=UPI002FDE4280
MDVIIKLNSQTAGRDKLVRLLQYASKAAWHFLQQKEVNRRSVDKLKSLEYTFSSFRKLLRLGRFLDTLYSALVSVHYEDLVVRATCTLSKIAHALFLLADNMLWVGRTGLVSVDSERWNKVANKYWLASVAMNLARDLYEVLRLLERGSRGPPAPAWYSAGPPRKGLPLATLAREHKDVLVDTVKNGCDLMIPLTALGYARLSPGAVGVLGVVSSLAAIVGLVDPEARLEPS